MFVICATDTFFEWTQLFLESFFISNGNRHKIYLAGLDLTEDMMNRFKLIYPGIIIHNEKIDKVHLMKHYQKKSTELKQARERLSDGFKNKSRWFSQYVLQYRSKQLQVAMEKYPEEEWFILYDVDFIIRKSVQPLIDLVKSHDVSLVFRPNMKSVMDTEKEQVKKDFMRVAGGVSGYNGVNGKKFVDKWNELIISKDLRNIPVNVYIWDQAKMYESFLYYKDQFNWGEIENKSWISAGYHCWKPAWGGHRKASNIRVEIGSKDNAKTYNCHTRTILRNKIFVPELERLRKEAIDNNVKWSDKIQNESYSEQLRKKWVEEQNRIKRKKEKNRR